MTLTVRRRKTSGTANRRAYSTVPFEEYARLTDSPRLRDLFGRRHYYGYLCVNPRVQLARYIDAIWMSVDRLLTPPGVSRGDRDQVSPLSVDILTKVVRNIHHEEVSKEKLLKEVFLIEVDHDKLYLPVFGL